VLRAFSFAIVLALIPLTVHAQPKLKITSPAAGTVVKPGQTIVVNVAVSGGSFISVTANVVGSSRGPIMLTSSPYEFSFDMPSTLPLGPADILALGTIAAGDIFAPPASIDLERPDSPTSLALNVPMLELQVGNTFPIFVSGTYGDRSVVDLTKSTRTTYEPADRGVVSIRADGILNALAAGSTTIEVRHKDKRAIVRITVILKRD
jgi:hypothetical protein